MSTAENKIKFGLSRVYYAIATIAADGTATYGNPKAFPGAVSLSLDPQGENTPFYADNIVYWMGVGNTGYQGDLEMAMITDTVLKDIFGYKEGGNGLLYEDGRLLPYTSRSSSRSRATSPDPGTFFTTARRPVRTPADLPSRRLSSRRPRRSL